MLKDKRNKENNSFFHVTTKTMIHLFIHPYNNQTANNKNLKKNK